MPCWQSLQTLCAQLFFDFLQISWASAVVLLGVWLWLWLCLAFAFAFALGGEGKAQKHKKGTEVEETQPQKTSNGGKKASRPANLLGGVGLEWLCCTQQLFQTPDTEHCVSAYRKTTRTQTYTGRQERTAYTSRQLEQGDRIEYLCLGLCLSCCVCASGSVSLWLCVGVCLWGEGRRHF